MERRAPHTVPHYIIYGFFVLGLLTALVYLLDSIRISKENVNYVIISLFSVLAIVADMVLMHVG
jgi:hypothetical protein